MIYLEITTVLIITGIALWALWRSAYWKREFRKQTGRYVDEYISKRIMQIKISHTDQPRDERGRFVSKEV